MNKIVFPALLVATIMVAGAFAFMPVEQASTVHTTTGIAAIVDSAEDVDTSAVTVIVATSATLKTGNICLEYTEDTTDDNPALVLSLDAADVSTTTLIADITGENCVSFTGYGLNLDGATTEAADDLDYAVSYTERTP